MFGELRTCIIIYLIGWRRENNIVAAWFIFKVGRYMTGTKGKSEFCSLKTINASEGTELIFSLRANHFVLTLVVLLSCCPFSSVAFEMLF